MRKTGRCVAADAWLKQNGGQGIPHEEVLGEFGLSVEDFPLR